MRFIIEFKIDADELKYAENPVISHRDSCAKERIGQKIVESFSWSKKGFATPDGEIGEIHSLEIEAFPMDKWMKFKTKLFHHLLQLNIPTSYFDHMIKELESFGKPEHEQSKTTK